MLKTIEGRRLLFVALIGSIFPLACVEKRAVDIVGPEQPVSDLPVAPAAPVAPEAPVSLEVDQIQTKAPASKNKKGSVRPTKKVQNKRSTK